MARSIARSKAARWRRPERPARGRLVGPAAGGPGRRPRGGVRRGVQGGRAHRPADLRLSGRAALPLHRSGRKRAGGLGDGLRTAPAQGRRFSRSATLATLPSSASMTSPPVSRSRGASRVSQRARQARGRRRSATTMSAAAQARVSSAQSSRWVERSASRVRPRRQGRRRRHRRCNGPAVGGERRRIAIEAGILGHQVAHEVARSVAQQPGRALLVDHRQMLAVAGDEQVGQRLGKGEEDAGGDRRQAPAAPRLRPQRRATGRRRRSTRRRRGMAGRMASLRRVRPRHAQARGAKPIDQPVRVHKGAPSPTEVEQQAPASSGMMTKVVSGMATRFAATP
jgi:hypothetical protein